MKLLIFLVSLVISSFAFAATGANGTCSFADIAKTFHDKVGGDSTLEVYKFARSGDNPKLVDPKSSYSVYHSYTSGHGSNLNIDSLKLTDTFIAYMYRDKVLKVEMSYYSPAPKDSGVPNLGDLTLGYITTYIISPIIYKNAQLDGFVVLGLGKSIKEENVEDYLGTISDKLSTVLHTECGGV